MISSARTIDIIVCDFEWRTQKETCLYVDGHTRALTVSNRAYRGLIDFVPKTTREPCRLGAAGDDAKGD